MARESAGADGSDLHAEHMKFPPLGSISQNQPDQTTGRAMDPERPQRFGTLYDVVRAALMEVHTPLPDEPNPCIVAYGVDVLAEHVTAYLEDSGLLTSDSP